MLYRNVQVCKASLLYKSEIDNFEFKWPTLVASVVSSNSGWTLFGFPTTTNIRARRKNVDKCVFLALSQFSEFKSLTLSSPRDIFWRGIYFCRRWDSNPGWLQRIWLQRMWLWRQRRLRWLSNIILFCLSQVKIFFISDVARVFTKVDHIHSFRAEHLQQQQQELEWNQTGEHNILHFPQRCLCKSWL